MEQDPNNPDERPLTKEERLAAQEKERPSRCQRGKKINCPYPAGHHGKCSPRGW